MLLILFPLLYFGLVLGVGLARRKPVAGEEDFYLAKRSGGVLLLTGSLLATMFGSFGVLGVSGYAYGIGLVAGWYHWVGTIGLIVLGGWALQRLDVGGVFTLPELLGRSYGLLVRRLSAALIALAWTSIIAAQLIAAGKIMTFLALQGGFVPAESLGLFQPVAIVLLGAVFITYTCLGGQHSILRTDLLQAGAILVALVALVAGAFAARPDALSQAPPAHLQFPFSKNMQPGAWVLLLLTFGVPFLVGPDFYSRVFSGRNASTGRRAILLAAALMIPVVALIVLGGILGRVVLGSEITDSETILLELSLATATPFWCGLLVAALLAAVMSSADTCLLTVSTLVSRDLLFGAYRGSQSSVRLGRIVILVAGLIGIAIAVGFQDIVSALWTAYKLYSPAVLVPFLGILVFRGRKFGQWTGTVAVLLGGLAAGAGILTEWKWLQLAAFVLPVIPVGLDLLRSRSYR